MQQTLPLPINAVLACPKVRESVFAYYVSQPLAVRFLHAEELVFFGLLHAHLDRPDI
jgi:hypothetical protein